MQYDAMQYDAMRSAMRTKRANGSSEWVVQNGSP